MKKLRILALMHEDLVPPDDMSGYSEKEIAEWKTEYDVTVTLREKGHHVHKCGVYDDLGVIRRAIEQFEPHIAFNLLEEFHGEALYDQHVVSYLELMRCPYTGCNPRGLMLAHDKALSKKILAYHRIPVPHFWVFPLARRVRPPASVEYPVLVKSLVEEASLGISQASVVWSAEKLTERVEFVHRQLGTDAIAEQYIEGRELYVGVIGNQRLTTFPVWELKFENLPDGAPRIATQKVKWDEQYQKKIGLTTGAAQDLPPGAADRISRLCKRAYRILGLSGYARLDLRMTDDGRAYLIEVNPNPNLSYGEDFAESAEAAGISYEKLLRRIIALGLRNRDRWRV